MDMTRCVSAGEPGAEVSGDRAARLAVPEEGVDTAGFWSPGFRVQGKTAMNKPKANRSKFSLLLLRLGI